MTNRRRRPSSNQGLKVAAAVVAPVVVAAGLIGLVAANEGDGASSAPSTTTTVTAPPEAKAFQTAADAAFKPLADAIQTFLPQAQDFDSGKLAPAEFKPAVDAALAEFVRARDAVAALERYEAEPAVNRYYVAAAQLYVEVAHTYGVALEPAADPLRAQLNLAARRLRTLGDRIYDRARVVLEPGFYASAGPDVEVRPPTEVPDWVAEGMAAGPPLAAPPGAPAAAPPVRQATCGGGVAPPCREEDPVKEWVGRVEDAGVPPPPEVVAALEAGDPARLGELADRYQTLTRELWAGPDPEGERERAAVLGVTLLIDGEAARLGQAAALLPEGEPRARLTAVARRVLIVGDDLLDPDLGFRPSGLARSLLDGATP